MDDWYRSSKPVTDNQYLHAFKQDGAIAMLGRVKRWVLAMLSAIWRLRVAPFPASPLLTRPVRGDLLSLSGRRTSQKFSPHPTGCRTKDIEEKCLSAGMV